MQERKVRHRAFASDIDVVGLLEENQNGDM